MSKLSQTGVWYDLDGPDLGNVERLDLGAIPLIMDMMRNGVWINKAGAAKLGRRMALAEEEILAEIGREAGRRVNPESGDQVAKLLFDELGLHEMLPRNPSMTKTRRRFTTDDETLKSMLGLHPVVPLIVRGRELNTLRTTFVERLPEFISPETGRIHTTIKYTGPRTGRLASEKPNLMNIPVRSELGTEIRNLFEAHNPKAKVKDLVFVSGDLSQIEMRMAAHLSGDPRMARVFEEGLDIHTQTASALFRIPPDKVDKKQHRLPAKTLGFSVLFGVTPLGLQGNIFSAGGPFWEERQCEEFIRDWYKEYEGVYRWMSLQHSRATRFGMVWDFVGRHRLVPAAQSGIERVRQRALREAGNQPIQAGAQATIKMVMDAVRAVCGYFHRVSHCLPIMQIHDELLFETGKGVAEEFAGMLQAILETVVELSVPVEASRDVAQRWGDLK